MVTQRFRSAGAGYEVPPYPWKTKTQNNGKNMNTKDDLNEESLDPFGDAPVTVGTTNIQTVENHLKLSHRNHLKLSHPNIA